MKTKKMTTLKHVTSVAVLATIFAAPVVHAVTAQADAGRQADAARVTYAPVPAGDYSIDPAHSTIGFAVRHLEISLVDGRFKEFTGTIRYDDKDVTKSSVTFAAKVASIDTEVEARDTHLRSADFFEVEKYPEMTFKSTRVERRSDRGYVLHGDLTLKGVTKPVAIPFTMTGAVTDPWGGTRFGVEGRTTINRRDFGITYGNALPGGGFDVGDEVEITLRLEAVKAAPKPAGDR